VISFWERESFLTADYIIIGSGIVGLSTAAAIVEKNPEAKVTILERGILPAGASTKNAGFACIGSPTELLSNCKTLSEAEVQQITSWRVNGLQVLRQRLTDTAIGYLPNGSYELLTEKEIYCLDQLTYLNQLLKPITKTQAFKPAPPALLKQFKFNPQYVKAMVQNLCEGQIDTGKMMRSLLQYVQQRGVMIINGAQVQNIYPDTGNGTQYPAEVEVFDPVIQQIMRFKARQVAICTNAFAKQFLPDADITPGRGQVVATKPIPDLPFKGIFHFDEGYFYFRNFGQRVIFGGGRNLDFAGEATTNLQTTNLIIDDLLHKLKHIILPNTPFEIDTQWAGIMAFGQIKKPILARISPTICAGVRMNGMGVAIGSYIGQQLCNILMEAAS
jgi:glycine/D-amino acid oxidase-like deaminating enzyme